MQGFIIDVKRARSEDSIVSILTSQKMEILYRFYGARHSIVTTGYKIDFESETDSPRFMPKLRNITHLGFPWLAEFERMRVWQNFVALLYRHLKDVELPGSFYYNMLDHYASIWHLQNPKRSAVEAYLHLLKEEGRLHPPDRCFACGEILDKKVSLIRAYLPAHPKCAISAIYDKSAIKRAFETLSTIELEDEEVERLWLTMTEGM